MAQCVDKPKRSPKLHDLELFDILDKYNNGFVDYYRYYIMHEGKKVYGTMFKLEKLMSDDLKKLLTQYGNVRLFKGHAQYATELKFAYVLLLDHSVRERMN